MTLGVFAIVLFAAALHATWNAIVKGASDTLMISVLVATAAGVVSAAALPFLPQPAVASWPYFIASAVLQSIYYVLLANAYRVGDMSVMYPIMRGTPPLLVVIVASAFLGEHLSVAGWVGVGLVSAGILALGLAGRHGNGRGLGFALVNALVIASYTVVDGLGVRASGAPAAYVLWLFVLTGIVLTGWALVARRADFVAAVRSSLHLGVIGGLGTLVSYGIALWAMTQAPIAIVAALRETSILFGTAIAALVLRERVGPARIAAVCVIAAGATALRLA